MKYNWTIIDNIKNIFIEKLEIYPYILGINHENWCIRKKTLKDGLCQGVDLVEVDNGSLRYSILLTRGMGIWKASFNEIDFGWESPINGPVNPKFVNLEKNNGLGWLDGFDELIVRCGLNSNGPPIIDNYFDIHGKVKKEKLTLHGKIANLKADSVEIIVIPGSPTELVVIGDVYEPSIVNPKYKLTSRISTRVGSNYLLIEDEVLNATNIETEMELLYHCNFGTPFLEEGAELVVAAKEVAPRDTNAAQGINEYETYGSPIEGFSEQVYWYDLIENQDGKNLVLLKNSSENIAVMMKFDKKQLPTFTQWKNTSSFAEGYVTGLEPGTDYPNSKAFERKCGRLLKLSPREKRSFNLTIEFLTNNTDVNIAIDEISKMQHPVQRVVHKNPNKKFSDFENS